MSQMQKKPVFRRTLDNVIRFTSSIGENTEFTGSFSGGENIIVRGHVRGESDVNGAVVITETGRWEGRLKADIAIVAGVVNGDIIAREKIEILAGAKITGNLSSPVIAIETGAIHDGHMEMTSITQVQRFSEKRTGSTEIPGQ